MIKYLISIGITLGLLGMPVIAQAPKFEVKREALRIGMSLPEAFRVAIDSVREASGYKTIGRRRPIKLYRPEDTLSALGLTTADRVNALRRYLVRNGEVGVQSVYDLDTPAGAAYLPRRYIIPRERLAALSGTWTLLKLAQEIQSGSGVPRMPFSTAAAIVADCRQYPEGEPPPVKPTPTPTPIPTSTPTPDCCPKALPTPTPPIPVKDDPKFDSGGKPDAAKIEAFADCIVADDKTYIVTYGVYSTKVLTPEDHEEHYFLNLKGPAKGKDEISKDDINETSEYIKNSILLDNWNYPCLIEFIAQNAQIKMPVENVAAGIVVSNILRLLKEAGVENPTFTDKTLLSEIDKLDRNELMARIEKDIGLQSLILPGSCAADSKQKEDPRYERKLAVSLRENKQDKVKNKDTVGDLISDVEEKISQREKQ